ncbi:MAG: ABC transporter permease [Thaumarchaeota archaeon]|nr:ABC transporter permease [Nitrososphaerota archaeon]
MAGYKLTSDSVKGFLSEYYIYVILIVFWIAASGFISGFISLYNFATLIIVCAPLALVSLGQNMSVITGGIDLSVGAIVSLATAIASNLMEIDPLLAIVVVVLGGLAIGAFNGAAVTKLKVDPFIATLGSMGIASGIALYLRPHPGGYISPEFINVILYKQEIFGVLFPVGPFTILVVTVIVGELLLMRRNFGRMIYAIGGNETYARMLGVPIDKVKFLVYVVSGVVSAIAGLYVAALMNAGDASVGDPYVLNSLIAVTLGGTPITGGSGRFINTVGAAMVVSTIDRILNQLGVNIWWSWIIKGVLLAAIIAISTKVIRK